MEELCSGRTQAAGTEEPSDKEEIALRRGGNTQAIDGTGDVVALTLAVHFLALLVALMVVILVLVLMVLDLAPGMVLLALVLAMALVMQVV